MTDEEKQTGRSWLMSLFADDVAQKANIQRAAVASGYGLDPTAWTRPFPGTSTSITHQSSVASAGMTLAIALLTGLCGALGVAALRPAASVPVVSPAPDAKANAEAGARVRVFWGDQEILPEKPASKTLEDQK